MNDNVTPFRPREPEEEEETYWVCNCSCISFHIMGDGHFKCAKCGVVANDVGDWKTLPPVPDKPDQMQEDYEKITTISAHWRATLRRLIDGTDTPEFFAFCTEDDKHTVYARDITTPGQLKRLEHHFANIRSVLVKGPCDA